jgi:hypothetical protein
MSIDSKAIRAAEIITGGKFGDSTRYETSYGKKTVEGIAEIIQQTMTNGVVITLTEGMARGILNCQAIAVCEGFAGNSPALLKIVAENFPSVCHEYPSLNLT